MAEPPKKDDNLPGPSINNYKSALKRSHSECGKVEENAYDLNNLPKSLTDYKFAKKRCVSENGSDEEDDCKNFTSDSEISDDNAKTAKDEMLIIRAKATKSFFADQLKWYTSELNSLQSTRKPYTQDETSSDESQF
ncbi:Hypothetical protein CINCED_3A024721 [Cinara cedri]|uniref:Uncharacterized protein n=1 Tax=Cinara cedri TaxID=506608 RepID=A0A5E4M2F1_9HEMI|nr:Hypothetical protein CINCED_3A024721 [Cinara cedri]